MNIRDFLKKFFMKPIIPKKYVIALGIVLYFGLKIYVQWTPTPNDDLWPQDVKDFVVDVVALQR